MDVHDGLAVEHYVAHYVLLDLGCILSWYVGEDEALRGRGE